MIRRTQRRVDSPDAFLEQIDSVPKHSGAEHPYVQATRNSIDYVARLFKEWANYLGKTEEELLPRMPEAQVLGAFLRYILQASGVRKRKTLQTYYNLFHLHYKEHCDSTGFPLATTSKIKSIRLKLCEEFALNNEPKPKPTLHSEDLFELLETLWTSEICFPSERQRIELALVMQLASYTGNRPSAVLGIKYKDIVVSLMRHKGDTRPRLIVETTYKETKSYNGKGEPNTFVLPAVPGEPCLLFCAQVTILGLAFGANAFAHINTVNELAALRPNAGSNNLPLLWKKTKSEEPFFESLKTYDQTYNDLNRLGKHVGFGLPLSFYCFRRGAGDSFENSGRINESQRNVIMRHANSRTFQDNYIPRHISHDTAAFFRGIKPQDEIIRRATGMSRSIDQRRPRDLPEHLRQEIKQEEELRALKTQQQMHAKELTKLKSSKSITHNSEFTALSARHRKAGKVYKAKYQSRYAERLAQYQVEWSQQRTHADIEEQLQGPKLATQGSEWACKMDTLASEQPGKMTILPQRQDVVDALFDVVPVKEDTQGQVDDVKDRQLAIQAISVLSRWVDNVHRRRGRPSKQAPTETKEQATNASAFNPAEHCVFCFGDPYKANYKFKHAKDIRRHIRDQHRDTIWTARTCAFPGCEYPVCPPKGLLSHLEESHEVELPSAVPPQPTTATRGRGRPRKSRLGIDEGEMELA